ncbi:Hemicentin-1 [Halotydeus destructor]|nr:Hemicentin-1 [Halotydeus destructor]
MLSQTMDLKLFVFGLTLATLALADEPPKMMPSVPLKPTKEGASFKAFCSVLTGTPPFTFHWSLDGQAVEPSNKDFEIEIRLDDSVLRIKSVKSSHQGTFKCEAANRFGKDSVNFELSVHQPMKWTKEPQDEQIFVGRPVEIECFAEGSPPPRISWKRIGKDFTLENTALHTVSADQEFAGEYECTANNGQDVPLRKIINVRISVEVNDQIPEIAKVLTNLEVREKEAFSFICSLRRGSLPVEFSWVKNGSPLTNPNVKISNIQDVSMIAIKEVDASDAGNYTCKAMNTVGQDVMTLQLKVKQTPKWIKEPTDVVSAIGGDVSLECSASGSPAPTISWFKLSALGNQKLYQGNQLSFSSIAQRDAGVYECVAENGVDNPMRKSVTLMVNAKMAKHELWVVLNTAVCFSLYATGISTSQNERHQRLVLEAPDIVKQFSKLESQEASKFVFLCSLSKGSSPVEYSWTKNGSPLKSNVKVKDDHDVSTTTVIIDKVQSSDAGNYTCSARNAAGQDSHTLQLVIKQTPKWLKEPEDVLTGLGNDVSVECAAGGFPTPGITWFKLEPKRKLSNGNYLVLKKISNEANGLYECIAENGIDQVLRKIIRVTVNEFSSAFRELLISGKSRRASAEPPEIIKQSTEFKLQENAKFSMTCSLSKGTNPIKFSWTKNGLPVDEDNVKIRDQHDLSMTTLIIYTLKSSDAGNYTCKAENIAGQDSHSQKLTIKQTAKWMKEPHDLVASVGQDVVAECSASGFPVPSISWFKLNLPIKQKLPSGNSLILNQITSDAAGLYECVAENGVDEVLKKTIRISVNGISTKCGARCLLRDLEIESSVIIMLRVTFLILLTYSSVYGSESNAGHKFSFKVRRAVDEAPEITKQASSLELSENEKFSFFCSLRKGSASVAFSWLKDGTSLMNVNAKIKNMEDMSILSIEKLLASDAGNYTCTARSSVGQDSISLNLKVKQKLKWRHEPKDLIAHVGHDISLECSADGLPVPTIRWFRIMESNKIEIFKGNQMRLSPVTQEDVGTYECVADNGIDEPLRKTIKVTVNGMNFVLMRLK